MSWWCGTGQVVMRWHMGLRLLSEEGTAFAWGKSTDRQSAQSERMECIDHLFHKKWC